METTVHVPVFENPSPNHSNPRILQTLLVANDTVAAGQLPQSGSAGFVVARWSSPTRFLCSSTPGLALQLLVDAAEGYHEHRT